MVRRPSNLTGNLSSDIPSAIVVFLVALPLCLGISLASGAPFFSGLISGIIGGVVVGIFSGSKLSVSGPAAGLAALVLAAITNIGAFNLFLCAVLIAGILQMIMGFARMGGIANYFPSSVIKGMLTSIGILIIAKQIPHAAGYDKDEKGNLTELIPFGNEDWHELLQPLQHIDIGVFMICMISIVIMLVWEKPFIKRRMKFVPGALVAVIVSILLNELFKATDSALTISTEHLVQIKSANSAAEFFTFFVTPDFSGFLNSKVIITGFMIAIIASLETLLSIEAVDNIDPDRNVTNTNKELVAQGIGNTISGLIGGLPITSVIVRSSANVQAGAKSKVSTIVHGMLLLVTVIAIPKLLNLIPLSALAAILLLTGYKLCKISVFKQMYNNGKYQFVPFMVTVSVIIGIDLFGLYKPFKGEGLLIGVIAGILAASFAILHGNLKNSYFFHKATYRNGDLIQIRLAEEVSFLNKAALRETLDHIPENSKVIIDASNTKYIDFDVLELIKEFRDIKVPLKNIECNLEGFHDKYQIENLSRVQSIH
ncbi:SulP family inorganic anion transporter [Flavihumibacter fluvii]|uniref:SulP family inorganic anion transporter n=1 Tax=Flavihumibacter fluvii TaxID=2838157 RepID=UPI001BDF0327|nr:SulP family inorganic anion transporter [Flavihumibacter fluvii]ULQ52317.1 SulP family inorganic anion transporter [Flavihumibacter fluvii]